MGQGRDESREGKEQNGEIQSLRGIAKETVSPSVTKDERDSEYGEAGREWKAERRT